MSFFIINDIRLNLPMGWVPFQMLYLGPFSNVRCTIRGEDGDSFFKSVVQDDENVTFTLTNGDQIVLPKAKEVNFVIERTSLTLKFGASQNLAVTQKGVENLAIAKPDGWRAWLEGDVLTITAPAKENVYAETSGEVSVVAVGATATVIAKVQVLATDEILGGAGAGSSEWEEWN